MGIESQNRKNNLEKHRRRLVVNNQSKLRNMFKMVPSKPILTSVLKR